MSNDRNDYRGNPLDLIETLAEVAGGLGNWIANGNPDTDSIAGEIQQRYRDHCDAWSNGPTWVQQVDPGARLFLSNACAPWLDSQGSGDPVLGPPTGESLIGDDLTQYGCTTLTVRDADGDVQDTACASKIVDIRELGGMKFWDIEEGGVATTLDQFPGWTVDITFDNCCGAGTEPPPTKPGPNPNPRPDPGLDPEDEPFERAPGQPLLPMPRITDPFGDPVQLPNLPIPNIEGPSLYPGDGVPGGEPTEPGDKGNPDPPTETAPGGEEESTDSSRWLMGVLVEVAAAPGRAPGFQTQAGFVYTEAGFVYQGAGDELEYYEESERLLSGGQYFPAVRGYDTWRVVANPFYRLKVTPFYKEKE